MHIVHTWRPYISLYTLLPSPKACWLHSLYRYPNTTDTAAAIIQLGCTHVSKSVAESHVDEKNKVVTTCAFMCDAPLHEIFDGIGTMVQAVLKLA